MEAKTKFKKFVSLQTYLFHNSLIAALPLFLSGVGLFLFIGLLVLSFIFLAAIFTGRYQHIFTFLASSLLTAIYFGTIKNRSDGNNG